MRKLSSISVVIPTRNRLNSLNRILNSIAGQTYLPQEIIIVDSSDKPLQKEELAITANIQIIHSKASVCLQRNIGIEKSASDYILLCDDDIEVQENYLEELLGYLEKNKEATIVSGLVYEQKNNQWHYAEKEKTFAGLLFAHIFGLSVWTEIKKEDFSKNRFVQQFVSHYLKKGNRIAKSGWPIVIDYSSPSFKTPVYSLMASLIRSEKIKKVLFETAFHQNGIGDNYDALIGMDSDVTVLPHLKILHHEEKINRVPDARAYYYRISALHFILLKYARFTFGNLAFLMWSLLGNSVLFLVKGDWKRLFMNMKLSLRILSGTTIYGKGTIK